MFLLEFVIILWFFTYKIFTQGLSFKLGIAFGVLYLIFIPLSILIFTGNIELSKSDFGGTRLTDISLESNIKSSLLLIAYLLSLIIYLYFNLFQPTKIEREKNFRPKIKLYLAIYLTTFIIILIGSGLLKGGNWYDNRNNFFEGSGSLAVLTGFVLNASKLLIIVSFFYLREKNKISWLRFLFYILSFTFLDMIFSGNRIYFFLSIVIISLNLLKKYPAKTILAFPLLIPLGFYLGYFVSIFRHIRGPLFEHGMPTRQIFFASLDRAIMLDPPKPISFILNISESVNVNVIYDIFNKYDELLYGSTYLKTIFFYIPRSIWPDKPLSITTITGNYFESSSLVTTIIGEMYMNFSYFGIIILPFILWLTEYLFVRFGAKTGFFNFLAFAFGFLFFRMPYSDIMIVFMILILILHLSSKRIKIRIEK